MQPYFLPYIGYFQLICAVDLFIVYDDIKYTKKGWINRNRMIQRGGEAVFSLPLKGASDSLDVRDRQLSDAFRRDKLLNRFKGAYERAPYFARTFPLLDEIVSYGDTNLFRFLHHALRRTCAHLEIATEIRISSEVASDCDARGQQRVLALCEAVGATTYVNAIGGVSLYTREDFRAAGVELKFLRAKPFEYPQFGDPFVPWLSIVDVMMFNAGAVIRSALTGNYELI